MTVNVISRKMSSPNKQGFLAGFFTSALQLPLKLFEVCIICVLYLGMNVPNGNYICL